MIEHGNHYSAGDDPAASTLPVSNTPLPERTRSVTVSPVVHTPMIWLSRDGTILHINAEAAILLGVSPRTFRPRPLSLYLATVDQPRFVHGLSSAVAAADSALPLSCERFDCSVMRDGVAIPVDMVVSACRTGDPVSVVVSLRQRTLQNQDEREHFNVSRVTDDGARDLVQTNSQLAEEVAQRRRAVAALTWESSVNAVLADLATLLVSSAPLKEISERMLRKARSLTGSKAASISFRDRSGHWHRTVFATSTSEKATIEWMGDDAAIDGTLTLDRTSSVDSTFLWGSDVLHHVRPIVRNELAGASISIDGCALNRFVTVAACYDGEMIGRLFVANRPQQYSVRDVELLERLSSFYAVAVHRAIVEEQLRTSEERFRLAVNSSPLTVYNQDRQLKYTWICNPPANWTVVDIIGKTDDDLFIPDEARRLRELKQRVLQSGIGIQAETALTVGGQRLQFDTSIEPLYNAAGVISGITAASIDITARKFAEKKLRDAARRTEESLALVDALLLNAPVGMAFIDRNLHIVRVNESLAHMFHLHPKDIIGHPLLSMIPQWVTPLEPILTEVARTAQPVNDQEVSAVSAWIPGETDYWSLSIYPVRAGGQQVFGLGLVVTDVSLRRRAEEESALLQTLILTVTEAGGYPAAVRACLQKICDAVEWESGTAWFRDLDESPELPETGVESLERWSVISEAGVQSRVADPTISRVWKSGSPSSFEQASEQEAESRISMGYVAFPVLAGQEVVGVFRFIMTSDKVGTRPLRLVTAVSAQLGMVLLRKRTEESLRESENRFGRLVSQAADAILVHDLEGIILDVNQTACDSLQYTKEELLGSSLSRIESPRISPVPGELWSSLTVDEPVTLNRVFRRKDGSEFPVESRVGLIVAGGFATVLAIVRDVTERMRAEEELRAARDTLELRVQERTLDLRQAVEALKLEIQTREQKEKELQESQRTLTTLMSNLPGLVYRCRHDGDWTMTFVSQGCQDLTGYSPADLLDNRNVAYAQLIDPRDRAVAQATVREAVENQASFEQIYRLRSASGDIIWVRDKGRGVFDAAGQLVAIEGFATDITARKLAEEALRHSEDERRQSQKMEAIGKLAGGIAHDFNNLLTGINGYAQLLLTTPNLPETQRRDIEQIVELGNRAAALTRQLLAFSRKQQLESTVLNLDDLIENASKMLRRLIGEHISIRFERAPVSCYVRVDPGQMELVLMNLVVNARDAMPDGGILQIRTRVIHVTADQPPPVVHMKPGAYATISMSDTGTGIDQDILSRIFEPFFTTKEIGRGTGLGLSTVFGIVNQHGGQITVESEKGKGTVFTVYLPLIDATEAAANDLTSIKDGPPGWETILLVEDEDAVRAITARILNRLGYRVLTASGATEAERIFEEHGKQIALMLTDVVMPEVKGPELFERFAQRRPGLKVLYMSGYADDEVFTSKRMSDLDEAFLHKPFDAGTLAEKVRFILDRSTG